MRALTRDFKTWIRAGWLTDPLLDDRDAVLFPETIGGKYWLMHRPLEWVGSAYGTERACAWIRMMYLGAWVRRSNVLTGAEWMRTRFGKSLGAELAHLSVVVYAHVSVAGFLRSSPEQILDKVPAGWDDLFFGWRLDLDWTPLIPQLQEKLYGASGDGYAVFGFLISMLFFKGVLVSMAGPTPNDAIQHILSTRSPREAALENLMMALTSLGPRFLMIAGIAVIGIVFFSQDLAAMGARVDFEVILPAGRFQPGHRPDLADQHGGVAHLPGATAIGPRRRRCRSRVPGAGTGPSARGHRPRSRGAAPWLPELAAVPGRPWR